MFGLGLTLAAPYRRARAGWAGPAGLFEGAIKGAWYDPSDLGSMRQDGAGTIAAAVDAPVALLLDKSGNGLHQSQANAGRRPMLRFDGLRHYLEFDGVDDVLERNGMLVEASGSVTCLAAVRRTAPGAYPYISGNTNDDGVSLLYAGSSGQPRAYVATTGGAVGGTSPITVADNADHVLKLVLDRPGLSIKLYENGSERQSLDAIDADLADAPVNYLGGHGGHGVFFPGRIYGFIAISRLLGPREAGKLDAFMASAAGL